MLSIEETVQNIDVDIETPFTVTKNERRKRGSRKVWFRLGDIQRHINTRGRCHAFGFTTTALILLISLGIFGLTPSTQEYADKRGETWHMPPGVENLDDAIELVSHQSHWQATFEKRVKETRQIMKLGSDPRYYLPAEHQLEQDDRFLSWSIDHQIKCELLDSGRVVNGDLEIEQCRFKVSGHFTNLVAFLDRLNQSDCQDIEVKVCGLERDSRRLGYVQGELSVVGERCRFIKPIQ